MPRSSLVQGTVPPVTCALAVTSRRRDTRSPHPQQQQQQHQPMPRTCDCLPFCAPQTFELAASRHPLRLLGALRARVWKGPGNPSLAAARGRRGGDYLCRPHARSNECVSLAVPQGGACRQCKTTWRTHGGQTSSVDASRTHTDKLRANLCGREEREANTRAAAAARRGKSCLGGKEQELGEGQTGSRGQQTGRRPRAKRLSPCLGNAQVTPRPRASPRC